MEGSDLLTLSVSAEQAPRLSDAFGELRRAKPSSDEALVWLERLSADLDEEAQPPSSLELRGPRELLREGLLVAIDELGDGLSERCTDLLRGSGSPAKIRADARGLDELVGLLDDVEQATR